MGEGTSITLLMWWAFPLAVLDTVVVCKSKLLPPGQQFHVRVQTAGQIWINHNFKCPQVVMFRQLKFSQPQLLVLFLGPRPSGPHKKECRLRAEPNGARWWATLTNCSKEQIKKALWRWDSSYLIQTGMKQQRVSFSSSINNIDMNFSTSNTPDTLYSY